MGEDWLMEHFSGMLRQKSTPSRADSLLSEELDFSCTTYSDSDEEGDNNKYNPYQIDDIL